MIASVDLFKDYVMVIDVCGIRFLPNLVTCCFLFFFKIDALSVYPGNMYKDETGETMSPSPPPSPMSAGPDPSPLKCRLSNRQRSEEMQRGQL